MGRVIKFEGTDTERQELAAKLKGWVKGEVTWAQVVGMTFEESRMIAQMGCDLAAAGRLEDARILFEGLVEGNPRDAGAQAALGTVYQKLGRLEDAMVAYEAALKVDSRHPIALANRGELRLRRGDREGVADLARAAESDPAGVTRAGQRARALVKAIAMNAVAQARAAEGH